MLRGFVKQNTPIILGQRAIPVILAPNGTVATNGAITLGTALPTIYSGGAWVRLPANAVVGGLAGLYWVVFTSTTAGQVYTSFVDPATQFIPYVPTALIAAVGSNATYTQTTASDITLVNVTVPGGSMGAHGALRGSAHLACNSSAGAKVLTAKLGVVAIYGPKTRTTSLGDSFNGMLLRNRGDQARNVNLLNTVPSDGGTSLAGGAQAYAINTAVDQALTFTGQIAVATDYIVLEAFTVEVLPS